MFHRILCGFIYILSLRQFSRYVHAFNCTESENKSVDRCNTVHLSKFYSNITSINSTIPIFANFNEQRSLIDSYCQNYKAYISCITEIDPNPEPDPDDRSCVSTMLELTQPLNSYVCQLMFSMVHNKSFESCWAGTKQCKLNAEKQPQPEVRNMFCNFFEAAELQVNCAMDKQQDICKKVPVDDLRLARSETFNMLDTFSCFTNSDDEEHKQNVNEEAVLPESSTMRMAAEYHSELQLCTAEQNRNALVCLSELWGIDKYMNQLKDGKLWSAIVFNQPLWKSVCQETGNYHKCMAKVLPTDKPRCQFKTLYHSYASLLNVLCADENLNGIRAQSSCLEHKPSNISSQYSHCEKKMDDIVTDLSLVQNKNDPDALCSAFSAPVDTTDCMTEILATTCAPIMSGLEVLMNKISVEARYDGCVVTNETSGESSSEEIPKPVVVPEVSAQPGKGNALNIDNGTQSVSTGGQGDICAVIDTSICSGDSKVYGFHPLTVITDEDRLNSVCNVAKNVKQCLPQLKCISPMFYGGLPDSFEFFCGEKHEIYYNITKCLRNVRLSFPFQQCIKPFEDPSVQTNSCDRINSFINCAYPLVSEMCSQDHGYFVHDFLSVVEKGTNGSCVIQPVPSIAQTPIKVPLENVTQTGTNGNSDVELNKSNETETEEVAEEPSQKCPLINAMACSDDNTVYGFQPVTVLTNEDKFDAMCNNRREVHKCLTKLTCSSKTYYEGLEDGYTFSCTTSFQNYLNVSSCLRTVAQSDDMQQCVKQFENVETFNQDNCAKINSFLSCSYPLVVKTCGSRAGYFHIDFLGVVARGANETCATPIPSTSANVTAAPTVLVSTEIAKINRIPNSAQSNVEPVQPSLANQTVIARPVNCNPEEEQKVKKCVEPFKVVVHHFEELTSGGLSALLKGMNNITQIFHEGCGLRGQFENCVKTDIGFATECRINSCLLKLGDTECKHDPNDRSLEDKLRCMFTIVAEPGFRECMKLLPRDSFKDFNKLKLYLPAFFNCLKEPILSKCGEDSWRLVTSLSSSVNPGEIDPNCTLTFNQTQEEPHVPPSHLEHNELGASNIDNSSTNVQVNEKVIPPNSNITSEHKLAKNESLDFNQGNESMFVENTKDLVTQPPLVLTSIGSSAVSTVGSNTTVVCSTEKLEQYEDCLNVLGDLKPIPVYFFDDPHKIDKVCPLYNKLQSCLDKYQCRYPLGEAYKAMLNKLCTDYYDTYKTYNDCLRQVVLSRKMQVCIGSFQASNLRSYASDLNERACKTGRDLLKCVGDTVDYNCIDETGLNMLIGIYNPFVQAFKPDCVLSRQDIGAPMKVCNGDQRAAYFACRQNVTFNPISIVNDTNDFQEMCSNFSNEYQMCVNLLSCVPQPAHEAYNDTMSKICFPETTVNDFSKHGQCLTQVAAMANAQQCVKAFNDIVFDDYGKMICRKVNSVMDCEAPLILEHCGTESLVYMNNIMSYFMIRYRAACVLNVPQLSTTRNPIDVSNNTGSTFRFDVGINTNKVVATTAGGTTVRSQSNNRLWKFTTIFLFSVYYYTKL